MTPDILAQFVRNNLSTAREENLQRHQYLYTEGDSADEIQFVENGLVMITKLMADGREVGIMLLSGNRMFGHCEVLSGISREYQAMALTNCNIWAVKGKNFLDEMASSSEFSMAVAKLQNEYIRQSERHISSISHGDVTSRLVNTLNDIVESMGQRERSHTYIRPCPTHHDLAIMISSTRETVSSIMGKLRKQNIIDFDRKELRIIDGNSLSEIQHPVSNIF